MLSSEDRSSDSVFRYSNARLARHRLWPTTPEESLAAEARQLIADELSIARRPCVTASFQAEAVVLIHMLRQMAPNIPVIFIDTHHHFPQTLAYRDSLVERWGLNLVTLRAADPVPGRTTPGSRACAARSRRRAPDSSMSSPSGFRTARCCGK
jgi:3'-phosphoadenosine 5'-phosphosulfate sulfotransferase (PAPS reductase)/FAD synthetase